MGRAGRISRMNWLASPGMKRNFTAFTHTRRFHGLNPRHGRGRSGSAPPFTARLLTVLRQFEAVAQEGQQLVRGPEAEFAPRIDFLDPP